MPTIKCYWDSTEVTQMTQENPKSRISLIPCGIVGKSLKKWKISAKSGNVGISDVSVSALMLFDNTKAFFGT